MLAETGDGHALVAALRAAGHAVTESVAGRTASARTPDGPPGEVRVGGFGGVPGLVTWLADHRPDAVVDATHPFAAAMTAHAALACAQAGVPLIRWTRASWRRHPGAEGWLWVPDHAAAARAASGRGRVLLTVGRQELAAYEALTDVVARVTEPDPGWAVPEGWRLVVARGPFREPDERALLRAERVRVLVTKDAGGAATAAKLDAAAHLGVPVVVVERPPAPAGVPQAGTTDAVLAWVDGLTPGPTPPRPRSR